MSYKYTRVYLLLIEAECAATVNVWTPGVVFQVSKPSQEAYQNELNIESVERSFILSARSVLVSTSQLQYSLHITTFKLVCVADCSDVFCVCSSATERDAWLEAIAKAIDDYTKKKITFISSRSQEEVKLLTCLPALRTISPCVHLC